MPENKVSLVVGGQKYSGWESVEITSALDSIARSFQLGISLNSPSKWSLKNFMVGQKVQVLIDSDLVLSGYIEQTPVSYDANQKTITIAGRSKTGDLIDCCAFPSGEKIPKVKEWENKITPQGNVVSYADTTARNWKNEKIERIIANLIAPYGIKLISEVNLPDVKNNFSITNTDKIIDSIRNLTKNADLLFSDNENGDLVLVKKATNEADKQTTKIVLGKHILRGSAKFDGTKLYSFYGVVGQDKGTNTNLGKQISSSSHLQPGSLKDMLKRDRYIYTKAKGQANNKNCEIEAVGNQKFADSEFYKATYVVQGWRYDDAHLWKVNQLVQIEDPFLCKDGSQWHLIKSVKFSLTNHGGMTTELEVVPPDGFRIDQTSPKENAQSKTASTVNTQQAPLVNKNKYKTKYWS